ncbi:MAG: hypothetical protein IH624_01770 [Phycisphaerae bacterium]|nr:hypothetical protein [Phycisphaerae bacterium]
MPHGIIKTGRLGAFMLAFGKFPVAIEIDCPSHLLVSAPRTREAPSPVIIAGSTTFVVGSLDGPFDCGASWFDIFQPFRLTTHGDLCGEADGRVGDVPY